MDHFNNIKIYPRLKSLLVKNYFRFFKVNLNRDCPFWPDDSKCAMRFCQVENCEEQTIPPGLMEHGDNHPFMKPTAYKVCKNGIENLYLRLLLHPVDYVISLIINNIHMHVDTYGINSTIIKLIFVQ